MSEKILITGGAGFIGSHLTDALIEAGYRVRIFDNLEPQVHGDLRQKGLKPSYLHPGAELILGDVRDSQALASALQEVQVIFHFAAATGVGQSMYQIAKYFEINVQGTANLLDRLANHSHSVKKIVLASSRAVYGEGAYHCAACGLVHPAVRSPQQLDAKEWDVRCPHCAGALEPTPTPESLPPDPGSMYAITKLAQEQMCLAFGQAYQIPVAALRFFNVYGPRQSLNNPYTGIITVFLTRLFNNLAPEVYEDGRMTRDFVYVGDVVQANLHALAQPATHGVFNVGSGHSTSILELAELLTQLVGASSTPQIVARARVGDIRHCTAAMVAAQTKLKYHPGTKLEDGLRQTITANTDQYSILDYSEKARAELENLGLLK